LDMDSPKTLEAAILYFSDFDRCRAFLMDLRWPDGKVACPTCGSERVIYMSSVRRWKCYEKHSVPQFSLKTGTIFEDSPLGFDKWLAALWLLVNCKNGISSCEIARRIGITQKSAWFMAHRLRFALHHGRSTSCPATWKRTKHSLTGRPATCTFQSVRVGSQGQAVRTRRLCSVSRHVAVRWGHR